MGIFSKKLNEQNPDTKFVGLYLPHDLNSYLTLYSLCTGESKTIIVTNLVKNWKEESSEVMTIDELTELLKRISLKALEKAKNSKGFIFTIFKKETQKELETKGINKEIIDIIIKTLNEKNKEA